MTASRRNTGNSGNAGNTKKSRGEFDSQGWVSTLPARDVQSLYDKLVQARPAPRSELDFNTSFELLLAVILSAQATDKSVNLVTARIFPRYNTPQAIVALGEDRFREEIRTIGLAPTKARNVTGACKILLETHGGEVPRTREALEALPGVGRKTANVVLNVAFGEPTIAVDTHVFRVANRTGLAMGKNVLVVEQGLLAVTPKAHLVEAHHYLILHGRYVCTARKPDCPGCVIAKECRWPEKT